MCLGGAAHPLNPAVVILSMSMVSLYDRCCQWGVCATSASFSASIRLTADVYSHVTDDMLEVGGGGCLVGRGLCSRLTRIKTEYEK